MRELEIQRQIEFEKIRLEQEKLKIEMEEGERKRQMQIERENLKFDIELRMKELEMQNKTVKPQPLDFGVHFDVTKHIRLVPPFQEKEVDKYFLHFEKSSRKFKIKRALDLAFAKCYNWEGLRNLYSADCRAELQL